MSEYFICQDGGQYNDEGIQDLNAAIDLAVELQASLASDLTTFTVENEDGYMLACITNRRITGKFTKQSWQGDEAIAVERADFDATDYVLLMKGSDLRALVDRRESADDLGLAHVSWDGPFEVEVVDSICEYFGVSGLEDISDETLAYAKDRLNPQPVTEQTLELTIKVKIRIANGAEVSDFVENLDYSVISHTAGITVQDTELVEAN